MTVAKIVTCFFTWKIIVITFMIWPVPTLMEWWLPWNLTIVGFVNGSELRNSNQVNKFFIILQRGTEKSSGQICWWNQKNQVYNIYFEYFPFSQKISKYLWNWFFSFDEYFGLDFWENDFIFNGKKLYLYNISLFFRSLCHFSFG